MSATTRALELPELLENILHHLPTKDLLLAQRVSKHWLHLIKGSKSLRQALFYEPEEVKDVWAAGRKLNYFPEVIACVPRNSNVEDLFIPPFHTVWQIVPVHVNELLLTRIDYGSAPCDFRRPAQGGDDCDVELRLSHAIASEGRASWKRMFLTQPPVTKVVINATIESIRNGTGHAHVNDIDDWTLTRCVSIQNDAGIRASDVVDMLMRKSVTERITKFQIENVRVVDAAVVDEVRVKEVESRTKKLERERGSPLV